MGPEVSPADRALAEQAKAAAGGPAELARAFNVSKQAASEWGRVRPIPRHLRGSIEQFVRSRSRVSKPRGEGAGRAAHADQPLGYFATLARCLRESPLRPLVPDHTESLSARETEDQWRDLPEERRQEIVEVLHRAAAAALTIQATLPPTVAEKVNEFLGREIDAYLADAF